MRSTPLSAISFIERFIVALILVVFLTAVATAQEKPVKVAWSPPDDATGVDGYNIYRLTVTPAIMPADYNVNLVSPLPPQYAVAYTKLNTELLPKEVLEFVIPKAYPGHQTIVRSYSVTWDLESEDSDILTLRPGPGKVNGHKAIALILESSTDLKTWAQRALYEIAIISPVEVFRLRW